MTAAFVLGEVLCGQTDIIPAVSGWIAALILPVFLLLTIVWMYWRKARGGRFLMMAVMFLFGFFCMRSAMRKEPLEVRLEKAESVCGAEAEGVVDSVSEKEDRVRYTVRDAVIRIPANDGGTETFRAEKIYVTRLEEWEEHGIEPGEPARFHGKLSLFEEATNPGQFDFKRYYRGLGIRYRLQADSAERLEGENESSPAEMAAYRIKKRAERAIDAVCLPEDRGFFRAVLLGDRGFLSEEDAKLFREGGISHILAVSGLHVSLIGMTVYTILRKTGAGYGPAGAAAGVLLLIYGIIAGFGASVFRAVFMTILGMGANFIGRTYDRMSAMALALLLLLIPSPYLLYSAGVQLSFAAILAICVLENRDRRRKRSEMLEEKNRNRDREGRRNGGKTICANGFRQIFGYGGGTDGRKSSCTADALPCADRIREAFRMNAAIQLFTLPVILQNFFTYPAIGLLLNLVVIPLMAFAAASGFFGAGLCALGITSFAGAVIAPGHYIYHFYRFLCAIAEKAFFLQFTPGSPSNLAVCGYYVLIFAAFYEDEIRIKLNLRKKWGFGLGIAIALGILFIRRPLSGLEATFLDVRQGECLVLRYGDHTWISDCGSTQDKNVGENRLVPFLKSRGVTHVDTAFVSHSDADHVNGISYLLKEKTGISVGKLVLPTVAVSSDRYDSLKETAKKAKVPVEYMDAGETSAIGKTDPWGGRMRCIHPLAGEKPDAEEPNEHCLAFAVSCGKLKMILTADLPETHEKEIVGQIMERKSKRDTGSGKASDNTSDNASGNTSDNATGKASGNTSDNTSGKASGKTVTILKAGHHGSATSTSEALLKAVKPDLVVISCGRHNRYGHPAPETMERIRRSGAKILDTEFDGAITIRSDGESVRTETFRQRRSRAADCRSGSETGNRP